MTEEEAQAWLKSEFTVPRETWDKLEAFVAFVREEMGHQNLISKASAEQIWMRHIVDSAQLLKLVSGDDGLPVSQKTWLDLGTGAGFPGIVIAIMSNDHVQMVESRNKRIEFLMRAVEMLDIGDQSTVLGSRLEVISSFPVDVISARAFAPLDKLLAISLRFSTEKTVWLLPKGKNAVRELQALPEKWQKMFHVEQSLTDTDAKILVGRGKIGR
jgi:16S rRNA (guanine527-N7)-methyltransferase